MICRAELERQRLRGNRRSVEARIDGTELSRIAQRGVNLSILRFGRVGIGPCGDVWRGGPFGTARGEVERILVKGRRRAVQHGGREAR